MKEHRKYRRFKPSKRQFPLTENTGRDQLATGSLYLTLDSVLAAGIGGVFWILIAKIAPPQDIGEAQIVVALATVLMTFAGLGFNIGASKYIAEHNAKGEYAQSRGVYSRTVQVTLASSIALTVGLLLLSNYVANVVYKDTGLTFLVVLGALTLPFQSLFRTLYGVYQGAHRMAYCLYIDAVFLSLRLVLSVALVIAGYGALGILVGFAAGYLASTLVGMTLARRAIPRMREGVSTPYPFKTMFTFSLANYLAGIFLISWAQIPSILLGIYRDSSSVAFYNIALLTKGLVTALAGSIGLALLPTVAANITKGSNDSVKTLYNQAMRFSILLCAVPSLVFFLVPAKALSLISSQYAANASVALQLLMISAVGTTILAVATQMLNSVGRPVAGLVATGLCSIIGLAASPFAIILWGLNGAAMANLTAGVTGAVIGVAFLSWRGHLHTDFASLITPLGVVTAAGVLGEYIVLQGVNQYIAVAISFLVLVGLSLLVKTLTVGEIMSMFKLAFQTLDPILGVIRRNGKTVRPESLTTVEEEKRTA